MITMPQNPDIMGDQKVMLRPLQDFNYLFELIQKYQFNRTEDTDFEKTVLKYGRYFWDARIDTLAGWTKAGVIYLCFYPQFNIWSLDAYRDNALVKAISASADVSYRAGKLIVDWFFQHHRSFNSLWTSHDIRNRAATIVCKRLGFEEIMIRDTPIGQFTLMERKRRV